MFFSYIIQFTWWPTFGEMCPWMNRGWANFPSNYFVNELKWPRFLGRSRFTRIYGSSSSSSSSNHLNDFFGFHLPYKK